ncbi:hypothetical protein PENSPDRAFT_180793 [Peniophora sp. CONT]|nr:hypothetical protein PENSPDRAFT_180793 [Peniophora sp. CONT]
MHFLFHCCAFGLERVSTCRSCMNTVILPLIPEGIASDLGVNRLHRLGVRTNRCRYRKSGLGCRGPSWAPVASSLRFLYNQTDRSTGHTDAVTYTFRPQAYFSAYRSDREG